MLCTQQLGTEENRLLADNRCITINTMLTKRDVEHANTAATRLTWIVIFLAAVCIYLSVR